MTPDVIDDAIAEAHRRAEISDRDTSRAVAHYAESLRSVCDAWRLTPQRWLDGGAGTPTLAVKGPDGTLGVLKVGEPGTLDAAVRVMQSADGRGYARVLAWDSHRGALVTEQLGARLWDVAPLLPDQGPIIVSLLRDAWRVPLDRGQPFTGKAAGLLRILSDLGPRYGTAHTEAVAQATQYARVLAASERPEVVCHGDPHAGNVLRRDTAWALIDPDGFVGERSYDVGVVLRDACRELAGAESEASGSGRSLLRSQCARLAEQAGVDPERVWCWGFVERVTTGLYLRWFGYREQSRTFLDSAAMIGG